MNFFSLRYWLKIDAFSKMSSTISSLVLDPVKQGMMTEYLMSLKTPAIYSTRALSSGVDPSNDGIHLSAMYRWIAMCSVIYNPSVSMKYGRFGKSKVEFGFSFFHERLSVAGLGPVAYYLSSKSMPW
jgi:hypothetical protein